MQYAHDENVTTIEFVEDAMRPVRERLHPELELCTLLSGKRMLPNQLEPSPKALQMCFDCD